MSWQPPRGWEALSPRRQGQLLKSPVLGPATTARKPPPHGGGQEEACGTPDPPGAADERLHGPRMREGVVIRTQSNVSWLPSGRRCPGSARAPCCPWVPSARPCARGSAWAPSAGHTAEDAAPPGGQPHRHRGPAPSPPLRVQSQLPPLRPGRWGGRPALPPAPCGAPAFPAPPERGPQGTAAQSSAHQTSGARGGPGAGGERSGLHLAQKDQQPPASVSPSEPTVCRKQAAPASSRALKEPWSL